VKLGQAADIIAKHAVALRLRTLQAMAEISIEKNSTIIFPAPFMSTVRKAVATIFPRTKWEAARISAQIKASAYLSNL
jgi:hypothetical protein